MTAVPASASVERPLPLRMRPDLEIQAQTYQGRRCWLVTDPLALKYYRFEDEEHFLLVGLDNQTSAEVLLERFHQRFAPQRLSHPDLQQLLGKLHRCNLILSEQSGQGPRLLQRGRKAAGDRLRQQLANPLAIRFRGIDPEPVLARLEPLTGWLFSPAALLGAGLLGLMAVTLVLLNFEDFLSRLPRMHELFAGRNWLGLMLVLGMTKILHELGHALTCRRLGGQCPELGLMLLVFTPCLYANVSDSWRLESKWKRMAIAFAGIYVELLLAAIATLVWWYSQPGLINQLALNVILVCSVGTLAFNANPLMKYDGYYLLADWLELPNLRQRASGLVARTLSHWLLGLPTRADPWLSESRRWLLWCYALAAVGYRWLMTWGIVWFLDRALEPWGLQVLGRALGLLALFGLIIPPLRQVVQFLSVPGRWQEMKRARLALAVGSAVLGIGMLLAIPLPYSIRCPFYLQPTAARQIFVETPGIVGEVLARPGEVVDAGQPLVRLRSPELDAELARLRGDLSAAEARLKIAQTWGSSDEAIAAQLPAAKAAVVAAQRQVLRKQAEADHLNIAAPTAGTLLPAHSRPGPAASPTRLAQWSGQPLNPKQQGHFLATKTALGVVSPNPEKLEAILLISQEETEPVAPGQSVRLWLNTHAGVVLTGHTGELSAQPVEVIPASMSQRLGGEIPTQADAAQQEQPLSPRFQVAAELSSVPTTTLSGGTGVAYLNVGYRSLGSRLWRWTWQTFHRER